MMNKLDHLTRTTPLLPGQLICLLLVLLEQRRDQLGHLLLCMQVCKLAVFVEKVGNEPGSEG